MQIAVITTSQIPSITANSIQVMKVCQSYCQLGHDVTLIIPGKKTANWDEISNLFGIKSKFSIKYIPTHRIFRRYDFSFRSGLHIFLKKYDIVHTWMPQIANIAGLLGKPYIIELHGMPTGKIGPKIYKNIIFSKHKKRFLCITNALKEMYETAFQFKFMDSEIQIAPNGVVLEPYLNLPETSELKINLGIKSQFTAVYTGHLYQGRGMNLLIKLAKILPEIQFIWVGGREEDVNQWREYINKNLIKNIRLIGFVGNEYIPTYQSAGDVLLMPYEMSIAGSSGGNSVDFCSPMKMFEYMAAGKPIISSDLPILHEVLNEKNAIFCPYNDIDQWVDAINRIKNDPDYGIRLGNQARVDVEKYSWIERAKKSLDGFLK
ncbi:MAG: glycosyltransferase family 4 protein [Anaerolineaceae bacterium]|nr:glycosyltransferase family 4 protein [Anaerolineaceae bacterium]